MTPRPRKWPLRLAVLALAALAIACSEEANCPRLEGLCSIASTRCQREIFAATACVRGQEGATMPPIRAITPEEFEQELREEADEEDTFEERSWGRGMALFGLVPEDGRYEEAAIREQVEQVVAFYRGSEKDVTILIRRDNTRDLSSGMFTLSHEFVHALGRG